MQFLFKFRMKHNSELISLFNHNEPYYLDPSPSHCLLKLTDNIGSWGCLTLQRRVETTQTQALLLQKAIIQQPYMYKFHNGYCWFLAFIIVGL